MLRNRTFFTLYGFIFMMIGISMFLLGVVMGPIRLVLGNNANFKIFNEYVVWYSGIPLILGIVLILYDLFSNVEKQRQKKKLKISPNDNKQLTVVLTAYNDEKSIKAAVEDFKSHPFVKRVIVISNNSKDRTIEFAKEAGAIVHNEELQGYGACVFRALSEGIKFDDTELVLLSEGDCTFKAFDIEKFMSYISHADIVNGTRIVEQLQESDTQLSIFMHYGNLFVGKLLEMKYMGEITLTDVGTTYKLCRVDSLKKLLPLLDNKVNLEFNPYLLDISLRNGLDIIECPISFHPRVGVSKGGNINNRVAFNLGIKMIIGILTNWKFSN